MNKQANYKGGQLVSRGIEWTDYTWNPVAGCKHACRWRMPDGAVAICYAEEVAHGVARRAYPQGFEAHYWHPHRLEEPLKVKEPARIFLDSMSDLMGAQVPEEQVSQVFDVCRRAHWHTFQLLTKNAPRLRKFAGSFPPNVWVGVSSAPDWMLRHELGEDRQERYMHKALTVLSELAERNLVTWMSIEPLSWGVAPIVEQYPTALRWAVIGAASNGARYYQPERSHVAGLLEVLDRFGVPVFFKGNLEWEPWREEYPQAAPAQASLF